MTTRVVGYVVNGYGPVPGTRDVFRSPTLPGGLTIANNLASANPNKKVSGGGRLSVFPTTAPASELGGSLYAGQWDAAGKRTLWIMNGDARAVLGPVNVLAEYLHLDVEDDKGFKASLGGPNWRTDGFFALMEYAAPPVRGGPLTPWVRFERYVSRATGGTGREKLGGVAGGASWRPQENLTLKVEASQLDYRLPLGGGELRIKGMSYVAGMTVTY